MENNFVNLFKWRFDDKTFSEVKISELQDGIEDNWDTNDDTKGVKKTLTDAIAIAGKEPAFGNLTISQYVELKKNPEWFLLGQNAPEYTWKDRANVVTKAANWAKYAREWQLWTKKEGDKISVASGDKFISFEEHATKNINKATSEPVQVPGSENLFYTVEYSRGKKQIVIWTKWEDGSIKSDKARYYVNGEWKDSDVS